MSKEEPPERIWLTEFLDEKEPHLVMHDWHTPNVVETQPGDFVGVRPHQKLPYVLASEIAAKDEEIKRLEDLLSETTRKLIETIKAEPLIPVSTQPEMPYRGPISQPCSPCSAGDTEMKYHDHGFVPAENRIAPASPLTVPKCPKCEHEGGNVIDSAFSSIEVCNVASCDCECNFPTAQGDSVPAEEK